MCPVLSAVEQKVVKKWLTWQFLNSIERENSRPEPTGSCGLLAKQQLSQFTACHAVPGIYTSKECYEEWDAGYLKYGFWDLIFGYS